MKLDSIENIETMVDFREGLFKRHIQSYLKKLNQMQSMKSFQVMFKSLKIVQYDTKTQVRKSQVFDNLEEIYGYLLYLVSTLNIQSLADIKKVMELDLVVPKEDRELIGDVSFTRLKMIVQNFMQKQINQMLSEK